MFGANFISACDTPPPPGSGMFPPVTALPLVIASFRWWKPHAVPTKIFWAQYFLGGEKEPEKAGT